MKSFKAWNLQIALAISLILLINLFLWQVTFASTYFTDVSGHWAESSIDNLLSKNVIRGFGDGTFAPDEDITRAEVCVIAMKTLRIPQINYTESFTDVPKDQWYTGWIEAATQDTRKIVLGYPEGNFFPMNNITRQELCVMLAKIIASQKNTTISELAKNFISKFDDIDKVEEWAKASVESLVNLGIICGSDNKIKPNDFATRAEVATMFSRLLKDDSFKQQSITIDDMDSKSKCIVTVNSYDKDNILTSSGFGVVVNGFGDIVTLSNKVVGASSTKAVFSDGKIVDVKSKSASTDNLTVLKLNSEEDFTPMFFANSDYVKTGDSIFAILYDENMQKSIIQTTVSNVDGTSVDRDIIINLSESADNKLGVIIDNTGNLMGIIVSPKSSLLCVEAKIVNSNEIQNIISSSSFDNY